MSKCSIILKIEKGIKMRMGNKYRKPTTLNYNAGSRCSLPMVMWGIVGFLLMLQLYNLIPHKDIQTKHTHISISHNPLIHELEEVEEENIQMPPPRRRSPRAAKRKPKKATTLIDEFLDESSQIRHVFFPTMKTAVDPMKDGNESLYYYPGRIWLDTDGNPIQAHGGGVLYDERSKTYYWYGEYKDGPTYHAHKKGAARVNSDSLHISYNLNNTLHMIEITSISFSAHVKFLHPKVFHYLIILVSFPPKSFGNIAG